MAVADIEDRVERALAVVDRDRLAQLCCALVDVASPTGDEAPLATVIAGLLTEAGASGTVQPIDERQANAWGTLPRGGQGRGSTVMLYAPIDTVTTGDPGLDLPHAASEMVDHLMPRSIVADGRITGLGAMNPKGHAACVIGAIEAIRRSGVDLDGDLIAAFGAGGMPTNGLPDADGVVRRRHVGHGVGCSYLLEQGVWADAAVIAKSGWAISHEEVGLAWFEITVRGTHTYVGSRHLLPYRNAIADAATVVVYLERWFAARAVERASGFVAPQGIVAAVDGGWQRTAAFTPASVRVRVDLRLTPDQRPLDGYRELEVALDQLVTDEPGLDLDLRMILGIPGSRTNPDHWIHRAAVDAWEREAGQVHVATPGTSGATDANILRHRGIPTVRVGLPKSLARTPADDGPHEARPLDFGAGMNTVDIDALLTLTRYLVRIAIKATAHPRRQRDGGTS
jgi:acetylornithine deacetylase/succinyl-diaminopimelate desuccinylase-like protein